MSDTAGHLCIHFLVIFGLFNQTSLGGDPLKCNLSKMSITGVGELFGPDFKLMVLQMAYRKIRMAKELMMYKGVLTMGEL
jgi:hypothetical protein